MIELKNISKTYQMGKVEVNALQGVSLTINTGEFIAIMGPSGSGKSTLMHVIGLLDRPDSGEYQLCGKSMQNLSDEQAALLRNRIIGFIFQQFHLLPRMNVLDNTCLPLIYAGKRALKDKARDKIKQVGLADRIKHRPSELSGGQQQRVAIARSLVNEPFLILADEPTGNLDSKSREEILLVLKDLNQKGKTVVIVTHETEVAAYAKRVITMRDGKIISDKYNGKKEEGKDLTRMEEACNIVSAAHHKVGRAEFSDFFRQAAAAMLAHKGRSFLSILGILIGVAAVIAMLALGTGAKESIEKQLASLGSNLLVVRPGSMRMHGVAMEAGSVTRFTFSDVTAINRLSDVARRVSPSVSGRAQVVYGSQNWNTQVEGVGTEYETMRNSTPAVGRFFSEEELRMREKVVLLGTTVARELFGEDNPVGETIKINLLNFRVIGVLPTKGASTFRDQDDTILIPVTTAMFRLLGKEYIDAIYVEVAEAQKMDEAQEKISDLIVKLHRLKKDEEDTFQIRNMADIRSTLEATTKTMSMLLGCIAAISLLVGGIGIMNIMLVSVSERTREIGLRKAIGATNRDIMIQFLVEAVLMACIGGIFGIILGSGVAILITTFAGWAVRISASSVILATAFSVIVGVVFGLWPARQASRLNPIEALRYE
ncbi:MAG: MacB family efflux pump subunit [Candidatus Omnitrophica bacterium CG11_big_fil_rev_8_21_14_0_20_42_13]|uniref:MacB family efflux pump subunit n=1 Tax=Candidatus Ghiorseimicrobium undicola TaxID=1974746 RepID=A0A2H0LX59_9BACT|nr:MAG: MacB family efflux pump subunit [Candidatus Omnitrophica bacterium CG11_big_fil_rev_8_21_14_0_20_42_13]